MLLRKTDRQTETHLAIEEDRQRHTLLLRKTDRDTPCCRGRKRQRYTLLLREKDRQTETHLAIERERQTDRDTPCY